MISIQTADELPELKNNFLVQYILGKLINQICHCELIEQNDIDAMEQYPFFTFTWIDPGRDTTTDFIEAGRQYVCTMQIDCHAGSSYQAQDLAETLYEALHNSAFRRFFKQAKIIPQEITNASNRTSLTGINYDQDYGFDCSFVVNGGNVFKEQDLDFKADEKDITSIGANNLVTHSDVNANKKEDK